LALEHRVDRHSRAVHEETRAGNIDVSAAQTILNSSRQIVGRRQ
jgi:hypothetical protein